MNARKINILLELDETRYLSSNFLYETDERPGLIAGHRQNTQVAIRALCDAGLITIHDPKGEHYYPDFFFRILELTDRGRAALEAEGVIPVRRAPPEKATKLERSKLFWHEVLTGRIHGSLKIAAKKHGYPFESRRQLLGDKGLAIATTITHPHMPATDPKATRTLTYIPDDLVAINRVPFIIEADTGEEPVYRADLANSSVMRKLLQLGHLFKTGQFLKEWHFGVYPLIFTVKLGRDREIVECLDHELNANPTSFLIKSVPGYAGYLKCPQPLDTLLDDPWLRAGHESVSLLSLISNRKEVNGIGHREAPPASRPA